MSKIKKHINFGKSWHIALICVAVWVVAVYAMFYVTTQLTAKYLPFTIAFLFIYPIITLGLSFLYTRNYGVKLFFFLPMIAVVILEYILLDFNFIVPNYIVMSIITMFFGGAFGKIFTNENKLIIHQDKDRERQKKKAEDEKNYKSIID